MKQALKIMTGIAIVIGFGLTVWKAHGCWIDFCKTEAVQTEQILANKEDRIGRRIKWLEQRIWEMETYNNCPDCKGTTLDSYNEYKLELRKLKKARDQKLKDDKVVSLDQRVFPISAESLKKGWERARERASMEHFNFHDLRHEAISRLFESGFDAQVVRAVSGHKDMQSLKRYVNLKASDLAKMIDLAKRNS